MSKYENCCYLQTVLEAMKHLNPNFAAFSCVLCQNRKQTNAV